MAFTLLPIFSDLVSKAESFELLQRSHKYSDFSSATFIAINRCYTHESHPISRGN